MKLAVRIYLSIMFFALISEAETKWKADRSHTMINFAVSHMVISEVTGQFKDFDATMESSNDDFTDAQIDVTIKAKSIDTGTERRDTHLRSVDFFNAEVDSIITFKSTQIVKAGRGLYKIFGSLTIRGVTKTVVLDTKNKGKIKGGRGMVAAFKATTTIARKDWGLNWNRSVEAGGLLVGDTVDLTIYIEFNEIQS